MMNLGFGMMPSYGGMQAPMYEGRRQATYDPTAGFGGGFAMGGGGPMQPAPAPSANNMQANLAALYAAMGQQQGRAPNFMNPAMIGGGFPRYSGNGYDSSGINPHGMYGGGPQLPQAQLPQMQFPQNPGGFMAMRNLGFGGR